MRRGGPYQGHKNWNHWNVCLWLMNDEPLYRHCVAMARRYGKDVAAHKLAKEFDGQKTPDGAPYSKSAIRAALVGL